MRRSLVGLAAAALLAAQAGGDRLTAPAEPSVRPPLHYDGEKTRRSRRQRVRDRLRAERRKVHESNRERNVGRIRAWLDRAGDNARKFYDLVGALTNYRRNQWARAGYPGLSGKDPKALQGWIDEFESARAGG